MAKKAKKAGSHKTHKKGRRKPKMAVTVSHPRKVTLINPGPSSLLGLLGTGAIGVAGGAAAGFMGSKLLGGQSAGLRVGATIGLGLIGAMLFKRRPGLATAWGASTIGSIGYMFGANAGGGVVAANKADAVAQLAKITGTTSGATSTGTAGLGVLTRRGIGVLTPRGVGALRPYAAIPAARQQMVYS